MQTLLVAGGGLGDWPEIQKEAYDFFVGIDHGSIDLLEQGLPLDLAVGDFDSLTEKEYHKVSAQAQQVIKAPAEKDDTDTQLALQKVWELFPKTTVTLIGAIGGRLDHFLANLWLPLEPRFQPFIQQLVLRDRQNSVRYYSPGHYELKKEAEMRYLAYCCLTPVTGLTLRHSKYQLTNQTVPYPTSYASNEFLKETAEFAFEHGIIAVVQSRD
ncbi:thiamine diphosphokinase [Enterococcus faecalis]